MSIGYLHNENDTPETIGREKDTVAQYIEYFNKDGKIKKSVSLGLGSFYTVYKYSKKGILIEKKSYAEDSTIKQRTTYHRKKNLMFLKTIHYKKKDSTEFIYEYKKKTNSTVVSQIKNDSSFIETEIFYDKKGRETKRNYYGPLGQLSSTKYIVYNKDGNTTKTSLVNNSKNIIYLKTNDYDNFGNLIITKSYKIKDLDTTLIITKKYTNIYDNKDKLIKSTMYSSENNSLPDNEWYYFY